jgi:hypothetical protein
MEYGLGVARARDPLIAIAIFSCIAILCTALRLESRRIRQIPLARDDYLMIGALVGIISRLVLLYKKAQRSDSFSCSFLSASNWPVSGTLRYRLVRV